MRSITAYTEEIDDFDLAAEELFSQTEGFQFQKNSMAIVYAEEETDYPELYKRLKEKWDFLIIGCTTLGIFLSRGEINKIGISVIIITADDCQFSAGVATDLKAENYKEGIKEVFCEVKDALPEEPKLIISYGGRTVSKGMVGGSALVRYLDELGGGIPVYGGDASDNYVFEAFKVYYNDKAYHHGQLIAMISGNIDPVFICATSVGDQAHNAFEITRAEENRVYTIGDMNFKDAMEKAGFDMSTEEIKRNYAMVPFVFVEKKANGDTISVARTLSNIAPKSNAGVFLADIPNGATLSVGTFTRDNVSKSLETAFGYIKEEEKRRNKQFGTIILTSCAGRSLALAKETQIEGETYLDFIREGTGIAGMYAYGEYCPTKGEKTGNIYNMYHNFTFTIMAM